MSIRRLSRVMVLTAACQVLEMLGSADLESGAQAAPPLSTRCQRQVIGPLVANVPSMEVQPQFRLNGKPFPDTW